MKQSSLCEKKLLAISKLWSECRRFASDSSRKIHKSAPLIFCYSDKHCTKLAILDSEAKVKGNEL